MHLGRFRLLCCRSTCQYRDLWTEISAGTVVGHITPAHTIPLQSVSAISTSDQLHARSELQPVLVKAFQNTTLDEAQRSQVLDLCSKYRNVFSLSNRELGFCTTMEASIPLQPGTVPIDRTPYRAHPHAQEIIDRCVRELEEDGIVTRQASPYGSPVTLVSKHDGSPRFCVDYRSTVNKSIIRESWPMPHIESRLDAVSGAKFISSFDIMMAFHQIPVTAKNRPKTAFATAHGKWVFNRLPFGISSSPFWFAKLMD